MKRKFPKLSPQQRYTHWEAEVKRWKIEVVSAKGVLRDKQRGLRRARDNLRRAKAALDHLH